VANNPPRRIDIRGQDHMLAYITPEEGGILQLLGGSGAPGPMGIPQFGDIGSPSVGQPGSNQDDDAAQSSVGSNVGGPTDADFSGFSNYSSVDTGKGSGGFGLDDDLGAMRGAQAGFMAGMLGPTKGNTKFDPDYLSKFAKNMMIDPFTGKKSTVNPDFGKINYDLFGNLRGKIGQHVGNMLSKGVTPTLGYNHIGQVTGARGPGGVIGTSFGPMGLVAMALNKMGASTQTGYGFSDDEDEDEYGGGGENDDILLKTTGQPYQMPTNPYEDEDPVIGKSLPINRNIPDESTQQSPLLNAQQIQDQFGLSQGLDYTRNPFAGMSIQDQQTLSSDKEVMGIASLDPIEAENIFNDVSEENMVGSYTDSSKGLESIDLTGLRSTGLTP